MSTITSYKCPNCSSDIPFDARSGNLKCPRCGNIYEIEDLKNYNAEKEIKTDSFNWQEINNNTIKTEGRITYTCPSCNGAITADENMASTSCPYCGSSVIVEEQLSGMLEPDLVIPFKMTKEQAQKAYEDYVKKKLFLPSNFKSKNFIEKLNGIYVPYWLFDCTAYGQARFKAVRINTYRTSDTIVTEEKEYLVYREGSIDFKNIPVDASIRLSDGLMDALEPYNFNEAVDFNTAYLSGFLTEKYDQNDKEASVKANNRIKNSMQEFLSSSVIGLLLYFSSIVIYMFAICPALALAFLARLTSTAKNVTTDEP